MRDQLVQRGIPVRSQNDGCPLERSDIPLSHLARAALGNLDLWVTQGVPAPRAQRLRTDRDPFGSALGGVRMAQVDVPLARYAVAGEDAPKECRAGKGPFLNIRRLPLDRARLVAAYGDARTFQARFEARVQQLVKERWLLPEDASKQIAAARARTEQAFGVL